MQGVSVMMQNVDRGNKGVHTEHKSEHQLLSYLNSFQVTANGVKKWKIVQKPSFLKY